MENDNNLDKIKKVFFDESLDKEDIEDNRATVDGWSKDLFEHEALLSWQSHEYTQNIYSLFKSEYKENGIMLATNRKLTESQRDNLFHKQDALELMMTLMKSHEKPEMAIKQIQAEIKTALDVANAT